MTTEGEKIQRLINNLCIGQGAFADKIGIARSSLNRIIRGKKPLGKVNQKRIADGLNLSLGTFLFLIKQDTPLELFEIFQKLAAEQDKEILIAIKALLEIGQVKKGGKLTSDHLSPLLNHIATTLNLAKSLDK
jgi:transcriptional regulator with XRE-family HTH domain